MKIKLTKGMFCTIDPEDYFKIKNKSWCLLESGGLKYAQSPDHVLMHRLIMGLKPGDKKVIDHINSDGLDNRKSNMRICTQKENRLNARKGENKSSKYKGVRLYRNGRYSAQIVIDGNQVHLGYYSLEKDAALAYNNFAKLKYGDLVRINEVIL